MKLAVLAMVLALAPAGCMMPTQPAELVQLGPAPPPGPWAELHESLRACSVDQGVAGEVRVRIGIDLDGGAGMVIADRGGSRFETCIGRTLGRTRFPVERRGRTIEVAFACP
jgi:hypothetical protein